MADAVGQERSQNVNSVQAERLLKLAKFLREEVPEEKYHMKHYCGYPSNGLPYVGAVPTEVLALSGSGVAACALGWCAAVFTEDWSWTQFGRNGPWYVTTDEANKSLCDVDDMAKSFFGITNDDVYPLFGNGHSRSPGEEADEIENCVEAHMNY